MTESFCNAHPSDRILHRYCHGDDRHVNAIERHLIDCSACCRKITRQARHAPQYSQDLTRVPFSAAAFPAENAFCGDTVPLTQAGQNNVSATHMGRRVDSAPPVNSIEYLGAHTTFAGLIRRDANLGSLTFKPMVISGSGRSFDARG